MGFFYLIDQQQFCEDWNNQDTNFIWIEFFTMALIRYENTYISLGKDLDPMASFQIVYFLRNFISNTFFSSKCG